MNEPQLGLIFIAIGAFLAVCATYQSDFVSVA